MTALLTQPPSAERPELVAADDFTRLGIPPREARAEIIRLSVRRASETWIVRTRTTYNSQNERKLALVLSSGYRAIDPRRRERMAERLSLSLQDPNPPMMAAAPWLIQPAGEAGKHVREQFDSQRTLPFIINTRQGWGHERKLKLKFQRRLTLIVIIAIAFGSLAMSIASRTSAPPSKAIVKKEETNSTVKVDLPQKQSPTAPPMDPVAPLKSIAPVQSSVVDEPIYIAPSLFEPIDGDSVLPELSAISADDSSIASPRSITIYDLPEMVPEISPGELSTEDRSKEPSATPSVLPELFDATTSGLPTKPDSTDETPEEFQKQNNVDVPAPTDSTVGFPAKEELLIARKRLAELEAGQPTSALESLRRLQQLSDITIAGSADRFVVMEAMVVANILGDRFGDAIQLLELASEQFSIKQSKPATSAAVIAAEKASSITEAERATQWALRAVELAIRDQEFESANEAIKAAGEIVNHANSNELKIRVRQIRVTIATIKRAQVSVPDIATIERVDSKTATQVGRYLCLFAYQWNEGLPWLAKSEDAKLALAARMDLAGQTSEAAEAYFDLARSQRGRPSETALMRGIDLLRVAESKAVGLEAEQIKRRIAELSEQLPLDLRSLENIKLMPRPANQAPMAIDPSVEGLLGRVRMSKQDIGVLIRYPGGAEIGVGVLEQIFTQLALPLPQGETEFEFVGFVFVPAATTVNFKVIGPQPGDGQVMLEVNGRAMGLQPNGNRYSGQSGLPAGLNRIRWISRGKAPVAVAIVAEDDRDATRLKFAHDSQVSALLSTGVTTRRTISIVSN